MRNAKTLEQKAKQCEVVPTGSDFRVFSPSGNDYIVRINPNHCECQWFQYKHTPCCHIVAVHSHLEALRGRTVSAWGSREDALRQKKQRTRIGDGLYITTRRDKRLPVAKQYKPDAVWVKALIIADYPQYGYERGKYVYIRLVKGEKSRWTAFTAKMGEYPIAVSTETARRHFRVIRDSLGRALMAENSRSVEALYSEVIA